MWIFLMLTRFDFEAAGDCSVEPSPPFADPDIPGHLFAHQDQRCQAVRRHRTGHDQPWPSRIGLARA